MPRLLGGRVPEPLARLLDGEALEEKVGHTFLLLTADGSGWPHVAMLSVGEVVCPAPDRLRLALWPRSHTTGNLERSNAAVLMAVLPPATYYLRLRCRRLPDMSVGDTPRAMFEAALEETLEDVVAYAEVTSGIGFRLTDPERTLAAWREAGAALLSG